MLLSYSFSNFQSFRERTEVNLTLNHKVSLTDWMTELPSGERVTKLMAVIGANASGKTTLLKPLSFLGWFITESFQNHPDANIPLTPHATAHNEESEFECLLNCDGKLWRYVLRCTPKRVLHESLYQKHERFSYVFIRDWDEKTKTTHVKQQNFGLAEQEASKVRQNVSFIAWAAQYDVPLALRMIKPFVISNINVTGRLQMGWPAVLSAAEHFSTNEKQHDKMVQLLSSWDLGLSGIELTEIKEFSASPSDPPPDQNKKWLPFGKHQSLQKEFILPFYLESSGTQSAFVLLSRLLWALEMGGIAVIDELESDIHPHMLEPILGLFADPITNPHQAQLLFTCHSVEVLNLIHKSQVMLVEKDSNCISTAIRMDNVSGIRNDDNLYAKYMAGAYGAIPNI